jgi:hypothetical protein
VANGPPSARQSSLTPPALWCWARSRISSDAQWKTTSQVTSSMRPHETQPALPMTLRDAKAVIDTGIRPVLLGADHDLLVTPATFKPGWPLGGHPGPSDPDSACSEADSGESVAWTRRRPDCTGHSALSSRWWRFPTGAGSGCSRMAVLRGNRRTAVRSGPGVLGSRPSEVGQYGIPYCSTTRAVRLCSMALSARLAGNGLSGHPAGHAATSCHTHDVVVRRAHAYTGCESAAGVHESDRIAPRPVQPRATATETGRRAPSCHALG